MATATQTIGIGVIGAGLLGGRHAPVIAEYGDLLQHPALDAVVVATPDHLRATPTIAAREAGTHVPVETPLATDLAAGGGLRR